MAGHLEIGRFGEVARVIADHVDPQIRSRRGRAEANIAHERTNHEVPPGGARAGELDETLGPPPLIPFEQLHPRPFGAMPRLQDELRLRRAPHQLLKHRLRVVRPLACSESHAGRGLHAVRVETTIGLGLVVGRLGRRVRVEEKTCRKKVGELAMPFPFARPEAKEQCAIEAKRGFEVGFDQSTLAILDNGAPSGAIVVQPRRPHARQLHPRRRLLPVERVYQQRRKLIQEAEGLDEDDSHANAQTSRRKRRRARSRERAIEGDAKLWAGPFGDGPFERRLGNPLEIDVPRSTLPVRPDDGPPVVRHRHAWVPQHRIEGRDADRLPGRIGRTRPKVVGEMSAKLIERKGLARDRIERQAAQRHRDIERIQGFVDGSPQPLSRLTDGCISHLVNRYRVAHFHSPRRWCSVS